MSLFDAYTETIISEINNPGNIGIPGTKKADSLQSHHISVVHPAVYTKQHIIFIGIF